MRIITGIQKRKTIKLIFFSERVNGRFSEVSPRANLGTKKRFNKQIYQFISFQFIQGKTFLGVPRILFRPSYKISNLNFVISFSSSRTKNHLLLHDQFNKISRVFDYCFGPKLILNFVATISKKNIFLRVSKLMVDM